MRNRLLYDYHARKTTSEEKRTFRFFILTQFVHYGALLLLFFGGLIFIVVAIKALC